MRSSVVLPQPDGPRIEKNSPGATLNVTSSTAACGAEALGDGDDIEVGGWSHGMHTTQKGHPPDSAGG